MSIVETVFWKRLSELCTARKSTPTEEVKAAGLAAGNVTYWKNGRIPNTKIIARLVEHFGVEDDYFVAPEQKEKSSEAEASELSDEALMAARIIDRLPPEGRRLILAQMQAAERELSTQDAAQESP